MSNKFILAFDIGTTTIKAGLVNTSDFLVSSKASTPSRIEYPHHGWAEQDPDTLWNQVVDLTNKLISESDDVSPDEILGIIFTAHMAGVLPIDASGYPLRNIIIWLDERAAGLPEDIWTGFPKIEGYNLFRLLKFLRYTGGAPSKTGKDPLSKIIWIRRHESDIYSKTSKFLDVKGFLIFKCTGSIVTSQDEAHLTWLVDARNNRAIWESSLLRDYNLSIDMFPEIKDSIEVAGKLSPEASGELGLKNGIPVFVGSGDVASAAIGSGAINDSEPHIYIGTSDWIAAHISKRKTDVSHYIGSLLSAIPRKYLLIAEQEVAAGAIEWMMSLLGFNERDYSSVEEAVNKSPIGGNNLLFFPWLYGERSPVDDPSLRGGLINFSFTHSKGDVLRAVMEGVAYNIKWAYIYFSKITGSNNQLNIVGGGALFDVWCQIMADVLNVKIRRMRDPGDACLRGAATIAAVGLDIYKDFAEAVAHYQVDKIFVPNESSVKVYDKLFRIFREFYGKNRKIFGMLNPH